MVELIIFLFLFMNNSLVCVFLFWCVQFAMQQAIDKVKSHYDQLKKFNLKLRERKQQVLLCYQFPFFLLNLIYVLEFNPNSLSKFGSFFQYFVIMFFLPCIHHDHWLIDYFRCCHSISVIFKHGGYTREKRVVRFATRIVGIGSTKVSPERLS